MKKHIASTAGILLMAVLFLVQAAPRAVAQDQAPQPPYAQNQGPDQAGDQDQNIDQQDPSQDPPGRVAQLSYSTGSVSFQPGGQGDWVQAVTNRPLTSGDNLWADQSSRAELRVGSSSIRMDSETSVTFLDLDDHNTQIKLSMGSIIVRVRHLDDGDLFEVDTPNLAFNIQRTGEYRIDVNADGTETDAGVWQGRGEATGGGNSYLVVAGQRARFTGSDQLDHEIDQLPGSDDFDNWSAGRDHSQDDSESGNYVSEEVTGYEDLDGHGSWSNVAGYGPCWTPVDVAADWAPYRDGHWVWIAPWGWTWVDDEPWGFAPFHYGRWAFVSSRWYWVPGRVYVRPVYAPALVAFVGGGGFGLSVGGPGVAWFPLGPGEVYLPWYRTSRVYVNNVNVTNTRVNVTQVTNVYNGYRSHSDTRVTYVNQHSYAVTAVSHDTFVNARPVSRGLVRVDERQIAAAPSTYRPAEQPTRASMMGAGGVARVRPPVAVSSREVIATRVPRAPGVAEQSRPGMNVRTETPTVPQPGRMGNQPGAAPNPQYQAQRPVPRPQDNSRPAPQQPNTRQQGNFQPPQGQNEPRQQGNYQPQQPQNDTRPQSNLRPAPQQPDVRPPQGNFQPPQGQNDARPQSNLRPAPQQPDVRPPDQRPVPRPSGPQSFEVPAQTRPLVRSAPEVQQRPEVQRSEEQKFNNWQQQRQNQNQRPASPPPQPQSRPAPSQPRPQASAPQSQPHSQPAQHDDKHH